MFDVVGCEAAVAAGRGACLYTYIYIYWFHIFSWPAFAAILFKKPPVYS